MNETTRQRTIQVKKNNPKASDVMPRVFNAPRNRERSSKEPVRGGSGFITTSLNILQTKSPLHQLVIERAPNGKQHVPNPLPYQEIFHSSLGQRVDIVKEGVNPSVIRALARDMNYDQSAFVSLLGVAPATYKRKIKNQKPLDLAASERVIGVMRLVGQVKQMVEESGDATDFDASAWVGNWLEQPLTALGGKAPRDYMDSSPGQELVSQLLAQVQSGAYA